MRAQNEESDLLRRELLANCAWVVGSIGPSVCGFIEHARQLDGHTSEL